ncbi:MAG: sulfatase-like hydrolase/transferase [Hyphomonadaceae bacterium]
MKKAGYDVSRRALLAGAAFTVALAAIDSADAAPVKAPNIVFILADDLGAFDLSCYGREEYSTPFIDSLARDGMKFTFAYANSSTCAPTRVALISGRYQNRLAIGTGSGGGYPSDKIGYSGSLPSLPNTMKRGGYRTALIGKWDLGDLPTFSPNKSGYDEFFGFMGGALDYWAHDAGNPANGAADRAEDFYENEKPVSVDGYATDIFSDRACKFIEQNAHQPFFLSLHYNAPHWPWQTRTDRGEPRINDLHHDGGSPAIFAQMMQYLDEGVGRVLEALDKHGLANDTIVVFTSDNGGERFSRNWPLRGEKGDLWEGGVRVPLLVRWPGRVEPRSVSPQIAMSMDFLPTFAALAGIPTDPSAQPDGVDLLPQLRGGPPVERMVFWKTPGEMLSALAYPWKYLLQDDREYLYNLAEDVTEHANYKFKQPEIFSRLKAAATAWAASMLPSMQSSRSGTMDALEALDPAPRN